MDMFCTPYRTNVIHVSSSISISQPEEVFPSFQSFVSLSGNHLRRFHSSFAPAHFSLLVASSVHSQSPFPPLSPRPDPLSNAVVASSPPIGRSSRKKKLTVRLFCFFLFEIVINIDVLIVLYSKVLRPFPSIMLPRPTTSLCSLWLFF